MRRANFIVGFNNWGKSTILHHLFDHTKFQRGKTYQLIDIQIATQFAVQSQSNDDLGKKFVEDTYERLQMTKKSNPDLFAAFCPSTEKMNNSQEILCTSTFSSFDQLNFFLLKNKWDHHAELIIENIISYLGEIPNTIFYTIDADDGLTMDSREGAKMEQIRDILLEIYR